MAVEWEKPCILPVQRARLAGEQCESVSFSWACWNTDMLMATQSEETLGAGMYNWTHKRPQCTQNWCSWLFWLSEIQSKQEIAALQVSAETHVGLQKIAEAELIQGIIALASLTLQVPRQSLISTCFCCSSLSSTILAAGQAALHEPTTSLWSLLLFRALVGWCELK